MQCRKVHIGFLSVLLFFLLIIVGLAFAQTSFGGPLSGCVYQPYSPITDPLGEVHNYLVCSLYNDLNYPILLNTLLTANGADINQNALGAGYVVVINGDPAVLPDDDTGLWNQNRWAAVLFLEGDLNAGYSSDILTMYWPGAFPNASTVKNYDVNLYGLGIDSEFFIQNTPPETVYAPWAPDPTDEYDIYVPEPSELLLLFIGLGTVVLTAWRIKA